MAASILTSYAVNTGGVALIIALCTGQRPVAVWKENFLWTGPSYFAGGGASTSRCSSSWAVSTGALLFFLAPDGLPDLPVLRHLHRPRRGEAAAHRGDPAARRHLADLYLATIKSLALAIDAKDQYTHQHILRVQRYAIATAKQMGMTGDDLEGLNTGALLHDIGKLGVPEYVLLKPGRLTDEEFAKIKKHPEIGAAILDPVEFPWPVLPVVKSHHEKWDGTRLPGRASRRGDPADGAYPGRRGRVRRADVEPLLPRWPGATRRRWPRSSGRRAATSTPMWSRRFSRIMDDRRCRGGSGRATARSRRDAGARRARRTRRARDIQRAASELWALYEVAQTLSASLGVEETLSILARKLVALLPGTACLFLLKNEGDDGPGSPGGGGDQPGVFRGGARPPTPKARHGKSPRASAPTGARMTRRDLLLSGAPDSSWEPLPRR